MSTKGHRSASRAGRVIFGALVVVALLAAVTPVVPNVRAVDPTPGPDLVSPDPGPTPSPDPTQPPAPTAAPTAAPTVAPTAAPTAGASAPPASTEPAASAPAQTAPPDPSSDPTGSAPPIGDPDATPDPFASADPTASDAVPGESPDPSASPSASPPPPEPTGITVNHAWIDAVNDDTGATAPGAIDAPLAGMQRFEVYHVRFQVLNTSDAGVDLPLVLEVGLGASPDLWSAVAEGDPVRGKAFYAASDAGRTFRARTEIIKAADRRLAASADPEAVPVDGVMIAGFNPGPAVALPAHSYTEVEFAIRATVDAAWQQSYAFRLRPGPDSIGEGALAATTLRARPAIKLTLPASTTTDTAVAQPRYQLASVSGGSSGSRYPLAATVDPASPHISSDLSADGCASCHSPHRASETYLTVNVYRTNPLRAAAEPYSGADFTLCITCHVETPFADTSGSPNDATQFAGHGYHMGDIMNEGLGGLDIEAPGDGQGNALCAECHYNLHGLPTSERGLVQFAPDVQPYPATGGTITWDPQAQTCTLTCHGKDHDSLTFEAAPTGS